MALGEQIGLADCVGLSVVFLAVQAQLCVGVLYKQVFLGEGEHAACATVGSCRVRTMPASVRSAFFR
ncbi:hypothetical protein NJ76_23885 [Rhodococcus sp. IITR03]|nr:hypothetical protein NJ76_23885 [Rhodococcus sp. IITR03]